MSAIPEGGAPGWRKGRVCVVGSFNVDHVWRVASLPQAGATLAGEYRSGPGGKGFNQAMAARRAGAETSFVCALGGDPGAQLARALCSANGIDLHDAACDVPTGAAGIYVDAQGRNSIVIGAGANALLAPNFVTTTLASITSIDVLLVQLESPVDAVQEALRLGRQRGALTILNPAPANATAGGALLELADILTPNETEFAAMIGRHVGERIEPDDVGSLDQGRLHTLCRQLGHDSTVIVTLGASGCFVSHSENQLRGDSIAFYRVPVEVVRVIDTTGAGDAFNGALAASIAGHSQLAFNQHMRFASRYAGLSTEREGAALAMPTQAEMAKRFDTT